MSFTRLLFDSAAGWRLGCGRGTETVLSCVLQYSHLYLHHDEVDDDDDEMDDDDDEVDDDDDEMDDDEEEEEEDNGAVVQ